MRCAAYCAETMDGVEREGDKVRVRDEEATVGKYETGMGKEQSLGE